MAGLFGGVHLLPFYYPTHGADAGFDPIDHTQIDPCLGSWEDSKALGQAVDLMADLIVNHVSSASPQFMDYSENGDASIYNGMFLTMDSIFPNGATEADLLAIYPPRPDLPFSYITLKNGKKRLLWTTFTKQQIDINVNHPQGQAYLQSVLRTLQENNIRMVRLDDVGYAIKKGQGFVYEFREVFDGAVPEAPPPWLTAQIENAPSGGVDMVIAASGLTGMETVRYLYFNLNPAYDSKDLSFQALGTGGAFAIPSFGT